MLAAIPDHDLLTVSVPVEMNAYRPRRVVLYTDPEMAEHLDFGPVVIEGPLAAHALVLHDRLRFLGCVLVLPKHQTRLGITPVQQPRHGTSSPAASAGRAVSRPWMNLVIFLALLRALSRTVHLLT